ncbi:hypothetical protein [Crocosphaera sp. XPORK-15E]|uniref:hypothetical protein n=1 Tax=Crocosphaera sp. XPORK-15E TaxID=3110247 RepID=UPI002B1F7A19|nr:hypothetical protein [Crocosphaera sp. XPORK-15E]MEA5534161.1 hypothetical protein [Crocosphaera sp. XPORK-15E]
MTIDVRQAVSSAKNHLNQIIDLFGYIDDIRLEEIELSSDKKSWFITLGFHLFNSPIDKQKNSLKKETGIPNLANLLNPTEREYKVIEIDAETGDLKSIKIREL